VCGAPTGAGVRGGPVLTCILFRADMWSGVTSLCPNSVHESTGYVRRRQEKKARGRVGMVKNWLRRCCIDHRGNNNDWCGGRWGSWFACGVLWGRRGLVVPPFLGVRHDLSGVETIALSLQ